MMFLNEKGKMNPDVRFVKSEQDELSRSPEIEPNIFYFTCRFPLKQQNKVPTKTKVATKRHCISRVNTRKLKKAVQLTI